MNDDTVIPIKKEELPKKEEQSSFSVSEHTDTREQVLPRPFRLSPTRVVQLKVFADSATVATGDAKYVFFVPPEFSFLILNAVYAFVSTVSSSGALTVQVRNITQAVDMLATAITIDASENSSLTAATLPAVHQTRNQVREGDLIAIDVDGAGTGAKGLGVVLVFA